MKRWNGCNRQGKQIIPDEDIKYWNMQIDDNGTVYYTTQDKRVMIWCPANNLDRHLHRLEQIKAR